MATTGVSPCIEGCLKLSRAFLQRLEVTTGADDGPTDVWQELIGHQLVAISVLWVTAAWGWLRLWLTGCQKESSEMQRSATFILRLSKFLMKITSRFALKNLRNIDNSNRNKVHKSLNFKFIFK